MAVNSDWTLIEVKNWERYNPRNDRKMHTWFRLQNDIITDPKLHGLNAGQKFCAVCLLAEVSRSGGKRARISIPWVADQLKITREEVEQTISVLLMQEVLTEPTPPGNHLVTSGDQSVSDGSTTDGRTDGPDEQNEQNVPDPVFARETRDVVQDQDQGSGSGPGSGIGLRLWGTGSGTWEAAPLDFEAPELVGRVIAQELAARAPEPPPPDNVIQFRRPAPTPTPHVGFLCSRGRGGSCEPLAEADFAQARLPVPPPPEPAPEPPRAPDRPPEAAQRAPRPAIIPRPAPPPARPAPPGAACAIHDSHGAFRGYDWGPPAGGLPRELFAQYFGGPPAVAQPLEEPA